MLSKILESLLIFCLGTLFSSMSLLLVISLVLNLPHFVSIGPIALEATGFVTLDTEAGVTLT